MDTFFSLVGAWIRGVPLYILANCLSPNDRLWRFKRSLERPDTLPRRSSPPAVGDDACRGRQSLHEWEVLSPFPH